MEKKTKYHYFALKTISVILKEPTHNKTENKKLAQLKPHNLFIWAAARIAPKKAYFDRLPHPDIKIA